MDGYTFRYLDLAALPGVGTVLLAERPAFVFSADGSRVLLANPAGAALLGGRHLSDLLERRFSDLNPIKAQLARLARTLPTESARLEMLRLGRGVQLATFAAACRRINLPDGERVVFAAATNGNTTPLTTRAEALVDMIGDVSRLAALMADDGKVIAASGEFDTLLPAEPAVDRLIDEALASDAPVIKRHLAGSARNAGTVRINADGSRFVLLLIGPATAAATSPPATERVIAQPRFQPPDATRVQDDTADTGSRVEMEALLPPLEGDNDDSAGSAPIETMLPAFDSDVVDDTPFPLQVDEPTSADSANAPEPAISSPVAPAAAARATYPMFTWALDSIHRFSFVSPELETAVGRRYAAVQGRTWQDVAGVLALDPDGAVAGALNAGHDFTARVFWPSHHSGDSVATDLAAIASPDGGFRGFGTIVTDLRREDTRENKSGFDDEATATESLPTAITGEAAQVPALPEGHPETTAPAGEPTAGETEENDPAYQAGAHATDAPEANLPQANMTPEAARPATPPAHQPIPPGTNIDLAARQSIESGTGKRRAERPHGQHASIAAARDTERSEEAHLSNVVRLPERALEKLTGAEREAFRRIAETLGREEAGDESTPADGRPSSADDGATAMPALSEAPPIEAETETDTRILERVPVGIAIFREGTTLFCNRTLLELLGYASAGAFMAAGGVDAILPEATLPGPASADGHLSARRADGSLLPVNVWLHSVTFSGAAAMMLSLTPAPEPAATDSEDELALELVKSEARREELEAILDTATDGVIVVDSRGRIESMNRAAEALFDVDGISLAGRSFTDLLAEESHKAALDYLDGLTENGVASVLNDGREVIGRVPNGGLMPLFMTMGRIGNRSRGESKFAAVLRDITHWKNVEAELIAARRSAEDASAQKSDFLAKISHEIRTPLNAIIGFSEVMMEERFGAIGNDRYRDYMRDIHTSGAHLMSLINDLLDLSKIEAGKLDLSFEAVTINAIIHECVALMQPQANRQRIIIRTSLAADLPDVVADARSIRQILLNLMSNAVKFTRPGGQVIVSTALEDGGEVVMRIRDTGIGMSERDIETALKPFQQVATSRSDQQQGTGLGLPLTKALVEANRAAFAIESAPNQGTLVRVTFPTTRVLAG